jgi:cell division septation protein DedD
VAPSYYVIELSPRWLTVLLVALALVMVLAFAFGYGAAWSVLAAQPQPPPTGEPVAATGGATPTPVEVVIEDTPVPAVTATPAVRPTAVPIPPAPPTAVPTPRPLRPTPPAADEYWVQVLASSTPTAMAKATQQLEELGFGAGHRQVVTTQVAGGNALYKLRVGPFPDRESADRVANRMRISGFPDAWVVAP